MMTLEERQEEAEAYFRSMLRTPTRFERDCLVDLLHAVHQRGIHFGVKQVGERALIMYEQGVRAGAEALNAEMPHSVAADPALIDAIVARVSHMETLK